VSVTSDDGIKVGFHWTLWSTYVCGLLLPFISRLALV
jgi:hypothetical protein